MVTGGAVVGEFSERLAWTQLFWGQFPRFLLELDWEIVNMNFNFFWLLEVFSRAQFLSVCGTQR